MDNILASHPLSITILSPLLAGLIIMLIPRERLFAVRAISALGTAPTLLTSLYIYLNYDRSIGGMQFQESLPWVESIGISYQLGVDGISIPLVMLTAVVIFTGVFASWTITNRTKEFYCLLLLLVSGVFGVFVSSNLFFFFLFYELAVLPMYLLIGIWGTGAKEYSAMKLTLYLLAGSAFMLVGIFALYFYSGENTFNLQALTSAAYSPRFQKTCFFFFYIGFGILAGIWPLHTWSPDGHASAPTAVSMLHAGVLMKLGAYGVLRVGIGILPEGLQFWAPLVGIIAAINIVYGAYVAMGQRDLKYVIAYSSVSHMGVVMLGCAAFNSVSINGAVFQMVSHGIMTALFFALVGLVYEKAHTRNIPAMGGFARRMPGIAICFTIGGLASFGLPGTSGFIAELMVLLGTFRAHPEMLLGQVPLFMLFAIAAATAIVITATYVLRLLQQVFHGPVDEKQYPDLPDAKTTEWVAITVNAAFLIILGVMPRLLTDLIGISVGQFLR
ncbi:MAG: NADH-quinone oxidoreductase subunit M [Armatimonadetes bacterium]|nr:NADH-quinone oxidoreductase subunit M [Armatimonadota bacterium]NIO75069.1 NADH-quinone oxidoreductase subunit M [Armatimonadota bacterium]NIO95719.1 NADH-quinone oxidoreductase subunit M [Armatimonadota bacterium]